MKTKTSAFIFAGAAVVAAATAYGNADNFIVNKTNGLQEKVESTSITVGEGEIPTLGETKIPISDISDIRRSATADFSIITSNANYHKFMVDVMPKDKKRPYVITLMQKSRYDSCENRDDVHFFTWDPWRAWAELNGITVEEWVKQNGLLRTGDSKGIIAESLKPSTDYVVTSYYTDDEGHIDGTVHTATVRTDDVTMLDTRFEISVDVKGKNINAKVVPSEKNVSYWHGALSKKELENYGEGDLYKAVENYLYAWRSFFSQKPEDFFKLITDRGDKETYLDNLGVQTDYAYIACALDSAMNICSQIDTLNFHTEGILPSDNVITTTIPWASTTRALIDIKTTNKDPYIAWFMTDEEAVGRTPEAIIDSLENASSPGDLFYFNRRNGDCQIFKNRLKPGTKYDVLVFGYQSENLGSQADAEVTTTPEIISFTTPEEPGGIEDLDFYFQFVTEGGVFIYGMSVPSEEGMPYYLGYSASGDKDQILAELTAKATADGKTLNEYLLAGSTTTSGMLTLCLESNAMEGATIVEPGEYYIYAFPIREDGSPVDKMRFAPGTFAIGLEQGAPAKVADKAEFDRFVRSSSAH